MSIKILPVSCGLLILSLLIIEFSITPKDNYQNTLLKTYASDFYKEAEAYDSIARRYALGKATIEQVKNSHLNTRLAYKKIEFFADFKYHDFVQDHINGAPLYKVKRVKNRAEVKPPEGLQVLDEMVFSNTISEEKQTLVPITKQLVFNSKRLANALATETLSGSSLVIPIRLQLIRLYTLSLNGFDTPGSLNAINETLSSLVSIQHFIEQSQLKPAHKKEILAKLNYGTKQLKSTNFEDLDRLYFLKSVVDPLYHYLGQLVNDTSAFKETLNSFAINLNSTSLFDPNLINPYFFTDITKEEDNTNLTQLGKHLFNDTILSSNKTMSCATCHKPSLAFTDGLITPKQDISGVSERRNTPTLLNAVFADRYFYDLRAFTLEQQAEHVIFNTSEFNSNYASILENLNASTDYKETFKKAFGSTNITRTNVLKALASYVASLTSYNSAFDRYVRGESNSLNSDAKKGFNLFMGKAACATCHFPPTFSGLVPPYYSDSESEVLGVLNHPDSLVIDSDTGRIANGIHTEYAWMHHRAFKTTTVRNISETAPYFHNGQYTTLDQVLEFYNSGGAAGKGISINNQTLASSKLNLTSQEQEQLIAFLKSLSDNPFTDN